MSLDAKRASGGVSGTGYDLEVAAARNCGGVRYTIQANLNTSQTDRAALIAAAESAISAGPR
jgi:hypothetical protein